MPVYKTRWFGQWARREGITDRQLVAAATEMEGGLVDARLGSELIKKRLPAAGRGKRGGMRVLVAWRPGNRAVYVYGFAKSDLSNVSTRELKALRLLATELLAYDVDAIDQAVLTGELMRLTNDGQKDTQRDS